MSARGFGHPALGIAAALVGLAGCGGGGGTSTSAAPSLPVAAQFNVNVVNSVVSGSTQSSISFTVTDSTGNCIKFPEPFSDDHLDYGDSAKRIVWLVDCGTTGWFNVKFHALDVKLADTTVKWTVSEAGLSEGIVESGGLCIKQSGGLEIEEKVSAKPPGGCPTN